MSGFINRNLHNFVNIACNFSLQENVRTAAQGDLNTAPEMCFAAFLLLYRAQVAKAVAGRHPAFAETAALIEKNTNEYKNLIEALDEEFNMAAQFYQNPEIHGDPDYLVMILTTAVFRYPNDEITPTLKSNILAELDELDDMLGYANILFSAALWFMDYEGYRDAVMAAFPAKKAEFEALQAKKAQPGFIQRNWQTLVATGVGAVDQAEPNLSKETLPTGFMRLLLNQRGPAAQEIAGRHPEFSDVVSLMAQNMKSATPQTNIADMLSKEMEAIYPYWDKADWRGDPELTALLLAYACWGFRGANEESTRDFRKGLFRDLDQQENLSAPAKVMLMIAMWFENYQGYQGAVQEALTPYLQEKVLNDIVERSKKQKEQKQAWRAQGLCQYCGGTFTGMLTKKCSKCGKKRDY